MEIAGGAATFLILRATTSATADQRVDVMMAAVTWSGGPDAQGQLVSRASNPVRGIRGALLGAPLGAVFEGLSELESGLLAPAWHLSAITIYAWVGDISRFGNARQLASYAGLVPSTHQSGDVSRSGAITKEGSGQLRACLVQCGHVLLWKCTRENAQLLRAPADRVLTTRARRKIAVVAAARHLLRVAYYVLRDGSVYEPERLRQNSEAAAA